MVLLSVTETACEAIKVYHELFKDTKWSDDEPDLTNTAVGSPVSHHQLIQISDRLRERTSADSTPPTTSDLESLLKGARIHVAPPKPKAEKTPEYVALMARLREEEEQRAYERMINPPPPAETFGHRSPGTKAFGADILKAPVAQEVDDVTFADVNRQITLIINVLVTVIACSVGIWVIAWHWPTPTRLALSLGGSTVIGVAEVAIYFGYIKRVSDAKTKAVQQTESKQIVDTWVIDGKPGTKSSFSMRDQTMRHRKGKHR
ncbi:endoplasmic reticulum-based factor for assembly of V-ATPase-domain-containing protein [Elsinoe ampelina]|uniref:Endoplasmic reticulum-based factor for assembly of V-ATPase-domain-containing protein n=1 Tax=Elsinoe ampelina TaxID=302913 RepID=A0A6A6GQ26_9PEZI|nr:endoplasmic reticulum-based factor for assembly of V-ATPase-domain-containing protein [Elsinoe ampelina]